MREKFLIEPFGKRIEKPWGHEIIYTRPEDPRTGKALFIKAGKRLSLQYHDEKDETLALFLGKTVIWLEDQEGTIQRIEMTPGMGFTVIPGQKHRIEALEDSYVLEVSAPETGTTVRIEDDASRKNETEEMRNEDNRGWSG